MKSHANIVLRLVDKMATTWKHETSLLYCTSIKYTMRKLISKTTFPITNALIKLFNKSS